MERIIKRGDVFYAELNPVVGSEQGGTRPVLIISNNTGNRHSPTVIIAAITSRVHTKAKLPTHTSVTDVEGLDKDSIILLEQIRTIDKQELTRLLPLVFLSKEGIRMDKIRIDKEYVAAMLIELLFEKGLVNKETYMNIYKHYNLHISQVA